MLKMIFKNAMKPALATTGLAGLTGLAVFNDASGFAALGGVATVLTGVYTALKTFKVFDWKPF